MGLSVVGMNSKGPKTGLFCCLSMGLECGVGEGPKLLCASTVPYWDTLWWTHDAQRRPWPISGDLSIENPFIYSPGNDARTSGCGRLVSEDAGWDYSS